MAFSDAGKYTRFMGRFSQPLAVEIVRELDVLQGQRALDVGCGPGALTAVLADRLGADSVAAVDPSPPFVAAARAALPGVDVRQAGAEGLPFDDGAFDLVVASLVVHFMTDPAKGLAEMRRVTRDGGVVAAAVWALDGRNPLSPLWDAVADLDPTSSGEAHLPGGREGGLIELMSNAGVRGVESRVITVNVGFDSFEEWWEPFTYGVGPAGDHVAGLDEARRERLRAHCLERLGPGPFEVVADARLATGHA